jgi:hypothetical protein
MPLALVKNQQTGFATVTGLTAGGGWLTLGQNESATQIGPHFVGIDTSYPSPIKIAAAYDPSLETDPSIQVTLNRCSYVGYIQFARLEFLGQPLPPSLFGGPLGQYGPYATQSDFGHRQEFVDFMGPAQVAAYLANSGDPTAAVDPFFAVNSVLSEQIQAFAQLFTVPHPNGSLRAANATGPTAALGATLVGAVGMTQVDDAQISNALVGRDPVLSVAVTPQQVANNSAAALAMQALAAMAQQGALDPEDAVTWADITRGRQVGRFTLLSVANYENEEPVLCVFIQQGTLFVYLLPWEDMEQLERSGTDGLLSRIAAYFEENSIVLPDVQIARPASGRGTGGGLEANAFPWLRGPCLRLRLRTAAFGKLIHSGRSSLFGLTPLSGIEWALNWNFDGNTRLFAPGQPLAPKPIASPASLLFDGALATYYAAIADPNWASATVDVSNFAQAELDTLDFGGGELKHKFVQRDGMDL